MTGGRGMKKVALGLLLATVPWSAPWAADAVATVKQGVLRGTAEDGVSVYRGVPFAAPPVGALRWRPPQPATGWSGVRVAD